MRHVVNDMKIINLSTPYLVYTGFTQVKYAGAVNVPISRGGAGFSGGRIVQQ